MSTKPLKPIKPPQKQININDTESLKCDDCSNYLFIKSYFIRRISALMSPNGQEAMIPIEVFSCGNCGKVPDNMMPKGDE
jgi:hypothetical protein|tara:strand:+ start:62 stop:301 length:240 start_codon:yes stop_codon:yes gene_type:complete